MTLNDVVLINGTGGLISAEELSAEQMLIKRGVPFDPNDLTIE